ncbi:MAG: PAS domain-containing protein [Muribaculaceae bacterium]|nr:PAS domain-containing protein [Muribaculaceae bacterium]
MSTDDNSRLEQLAHWADEVDYAVTIADDQCRIIYMNRRSRNTFCKNGQDLIGANLMDCHPEHARAIIRRLLTEGGSNVYSITKKGVNKLIFQSAWKLDGKIAGLVETSMVIPPDLKHFDRG